MPDPALIRAQALDLATRRLRDHLDEVAAHADRNAIDDAHRALDDVGSDLDDIAALLKEAGHG